MKKITEQKQIEISCVIPAFNEEKRIESVLVPCLKSGLFKEIIVINDGSSDGTLRILNKYKGKIILIDLTENRGKGYAVSVGVSKAQSEIIIFLDADLTNLKSYHLVSLVSPIFEQDVDMTIGAFVDFDKPYYPNWPFSGQRAVKKSLILPLLDEIAKTKYAMEIVLNEGFKNKKVVVVPLVNLSFVKKNKKQEDWLSSYFKMNFELLQSILKHKSKKFKENLINDLAEKYFKSEK